MQTRNLSRFEWIVCLSDMCGPITPEPITHELRSISELSEDTRFLMTLYLVDGHTIAALAALFDRSEISIRHELTSGLRALERLKDARSLATWHQELAAQREFN